DLAKRYRGFVDATEDETLRAAVARGYHKLLAYKDEYEVARLLGETRAKASEEFDGDLKLTYHLAPPLISRTGPDGRPGKIPFGPKLAGAFPMLAKIKGLRGTAFDPFGYSNERRMERDLITEYEADMTEALGKLSVATHDAVVALALLPLQIRGFGPVKEANAKAAAMRRTELLAAIRAGGAPLAQAAE
ncbi:MAG: indolepyruvate ferredoxin oxidoreductase, partial [Dinoroseobacter sp.]